MLGVVRKVNLENTNATIDYCSCQFSQSHFSQLDNEIDKLITDIWNERVDIKNKRLN